VADTGRACVNVACTVRRNATLQAEPAAEAALVMRDPGEPPGGVRPGIGRRIGWRGAVTRLPRGNVKGLRTVRLPRILVPALLALVLAAAMALPVSAQEDELPPGLERFYSRTAAVEHAGEGMPRIDAGWMLIGVAALDFDSEERAAEAMRPVSEDGIVQLYAGSVDNARIAEVALDIDGEYVALAAEAEADGAVTTAIQVVVLDGDRMYIAMGMSVELDPAPKIAELARSMQASEVNDEPETFDAGGASTGGFWATLPPVEALQEGAPELTDVEDQVTFPPGGGSPRA
jgi:hypothetical protein